ncbi:hypothetical protein ACP4OV_017622 [Aristida adscensionis]
MYACVKIDEARLGADGGYDHSGSSGGSSPSAASHSGPSGSESDGSTSTSTADDPCHGRSELRRLPSASPSSSGRGSSHPLRPVSVSSASVLDDIDKLQQRMVLLLPAFSSSPAGAAVRAEALSRWLAEFDVGWVLDMDASGRGESLPRREVARRVRAWALALSAMERVFRLRHRELTDAQVAALGELAAATAGAMLRLPGAVAALGSSPSKLLAALDMYVPVSEAFPILARQFSWPPSHPVSAAAAAALAGVVDAARSCRRDLRAFIRSHYPWRMPQGGEVHPCVGFWMGYFRCMLRNRVSLYFVLGNDGDGDGDGDDDDDGGGASAVAGEGGLSLMAELISCLEAVLEERSAALAFPGLRQVFMLNNTFAVVRRAVRSDLRLFLPPGWVRAREQRMEGYIKGYMDASWAPVVSRLDDGGGGGAMPSAVLRRRQRRRDRRLGAFYSALEKACSAQRCWKVPSPVLRGILRKTVSENVAPAYRRYLAEHPGVGVAGGGGRTAEELEQQLSDLFEG